jgi:hypothetical protein
MVPKGWSVLLIVVLTLVCMSGAAWPQSRFEGSASITGRATDAEGKVLSNTEVRVYNKMWHFERVAKAEASDGTFAIERLPFGEYEVTAVADGYVSEDYPVKVEAGETAWIEATLAPAEVFVCPEVPMPIEPET